MPDDKKLSFIKEFISTLGFPIVVTGWLLYERWTVLRDYSATLSQLTKSINDNSEVVRQLLSKMGG